MIDGLRLAAAPITWGVCEVPGWGHQMSPGRVLAEMGGLGFAATEAGPDNFPPSKPEEVRRLLKKHGLSLAAGFVPVVLHRKELWEQERVLATGRIDALGRSGADMVVVAAATGREGYEAGLTLDEGEWRHLSRAVAELEEHAARSGMGLTVHPHYGTVIEAPEQVARFLDVSRARLCLDTGHTMAGGGDPVELAREVADRIGHVHLKDVDADLAARVRRGELSYRRATARGLYRVLGRGDVDVTAILAAIDGAGFEGWIVLEHDIVLEQEPPEDGGPRLDAGASLRHLESVVTVSGLSNHNGR